jgi:hypothetical protein
LLKMKPSTTPYYLLHRLEVFDIHQSDTKLGFPVTNDFWVCSEKDSCGFPVKDLSFLSEASQ